MIKPFIAAWILPDQLLSPELHPTLLNSLQQTKGDRNQIRVLLIESDQHMRSLPFHKNRLVLHLSAGRHFVDELKRQGWQVDCIASHRFSEGIRNHQEQHGWNSLIFMQSTEIPIQRLQHHLSNELPNIQIEMIENSQFYWNQVPLTEFDPNKSIIMENFYRRMRRHFQLLMDDENNPIGGKWNFDQLNRKPLPKDRRAPDRQRFLPDSITKEVISEVNERFPDHPGQTDFFDHPVTREQSHLAFQDFLSHRLSAFGPFEDAMSQNDGLLWHSLLSPQMNLGLLDALEMCRQAEDSYRNGFAPIQSVEAFIRQIIGWREYMNWQYRRTMPELRSANAWENFRPTPLFWWDGQTEMNCLKQIIGRLLDSGFNHHIERLMVLCNFAMLAGLNPESVANWFHAMYLDSHEWVVLPNVIGMGLNADEGKIATKPYIASGSYINKMSDFCKNCRYDPKTRTGPNACPFNTLYWNFLIKNETILRSNPRMGPNVLGLKHISSNQRAEITAEAQEFLQKLSEYDDPIFDPDTH